MERWPAWTTVLLWFEVCEFYNPSPFVSLIGDELAEVLRRAPEYRATKVRKASLELCVLKTPIDCFVEFLDDRNGSVSGRAYHDRRPVGLSMARRRCR
jgi:hypothetical protein